MEDDAGLPKTAGRFRAWMFWRRERALSFASTHTLHVALLLSKGRGSLLERQENTAIIASRQSHTERDTETSLAAKPSKLSDKHERFVQELMSNGGNLGEAYRAVYPNARSQQVVWVNATRLRARQDVQERIAELTAIAAERALVKPTELLRELYEIACLADPAELSRVVIDPCPVCWSDDALIAAIDAAGAAGAPMPDTEAPRADCAHCRGRGSSRVVITPTHDLRGPARRLYQSARQRADGSIEVNVIDQAAMRIELHKLLGMHVSRSVSTNLNVNVDPSKPNPWSGANLTPEQVLQRVRKSRQPVTLEHAPQATPTGEGA